MGDDQQNRIGRLLFHIVATTILTLLLPASFVLLSHRFSTQESSFLTFISPSLWAEILYLLFFLIGFSSLAAGIRSSPRSETPLTPTRIAFSWLCLFLLITCVACGVGGRVTAGFREGSEKGWIWRGLLLVGLHEMMVFWGRTAVKPAVDDTLYGGWREEGLPEKVITAIGCGGVWWCLMRTESLIITGSFPGFWLHYLMIAIGISKFYRGFLFMAACRRKPTE
ncbi:hypothetical protein M569_16675, partial [Genlisea aurea]